MSPLPVCKIHGKQPLIFYQCCAGAKGGRKTSRKKRASSRINAEKGRRVRLQNLDPWLRDHPEGLR